MKIGIVIAVELNSFIKSYEGKYEKHKVHGFDIYIVKSELVEIFAVKSMAGQIFSSAATMLLLNEYSVDMIINYGVVGSLIDDVKTYDKCIVEKVVHYNFDTSAADGYEVGHHLGYKDIYIPANRRLIEIVQNIDKNIKLVCCASGDKFITDKHEKERLSKEFKADICDMEAAGILLIADRANVPCLIIKTVSDSITGGAEELYKRFEECSQLCIEIIKKAVHIFGKM